MGVVAAHLSARHEGECYGGLVPDTHDIICSVPVPPGKMTDGSIQWKKEADAVLE